MESIAHKFGMKKSELLDPDAENMAVRVALAETQLLSETKAFLEDVDICNTTMLMQPGGCVLGNSWGP